MNPATSFKRSLVCFVAITCAENITDTPATRDLDPLSVDLIDACFDRIAKDGVLTFDTFTSLLFGGKGKPASIEELLAKLEGPMYAENSGMTRYLLIQLDLPHHTREYKPDLWAHDEKGQFVWTIEHVLPKTPNLPPTGCR